MALTTPVEGDQHRGRFEAAAVVTMIHDPDQREEDFAENRRSEVRFGAKCLCVYVNE